MLYLGSLEYATEVCEECFVVAFIERVQEDLEVWHVSDDWDNIRGVDNLILEGN